MSPHLHKFKVECEIEKSHKHRMTGFTENMIGINSFHFHYFYGISSYSNHTHYYSGVSGLPVKTKNGHVHKLEGLFEVNGTHDHKYNDYTFEDIEYIPKKLINEAYV